jgi:putative FmdB family regulatory protein
VPVYDYACTQCGRTVEVTHGVHAHGPSVCEVCGGQMRKLLSTPAIVFKGSGWAKKDAQAASHARNTQKSTSASGSSGSAAGSATAPAAGGSGESAGAGGSGGATATSSGGSTATSLDKGSTSRGSGAD